jgi:ArsR family transcriptional regulator
LDIDAHRYLAPDIDGCQYPPMPNVARCCPPVFRGHLSKRDAEELAGVLKALGDPARLQLLSFIAAQPEGEACVCHVVDAIDLSQPTVSHHLKLLHEAGLLEREKRGAWVYYRAVPDRLESLRAALAPVPQARARRRA